MSQPAGSADQPASARRGDGGHSGSGVSGSGGLSGRDAAILAFEQEWWRQDGAKDEGIRVRFGLSVARYYQLLNTLIDSPAAVAHDPMLVRRLQRVRDARMSERAAARARPTPDDRPSDDD